MGPPASDIAADESGDVGVKGRWYIAAESIFVSSIVDGRLGRLVCYDCREGGFTSTQTALGFQNTIVKGFSKKQRTFRGLPLRTPIRLTVTEQDCSAEVSVLVGGDM